MELLQLLASQQGHFVDNHCLWARSMLSVLLRFLFVLHAHTLSHIHTILVTHKSTVESKGYIPASIGQFTFRCPILKQLKHGPGVLGVKELSLNCCLGNKANFWGWDWACPLLEPCIVMTHIAAAFQCFLVTCCSAVLSAFSRYLTSSSSLVRSLPL